MDKYTCFFVEQDEAAIFEDAITLQLESDSPEGAAKEYVNQHGPIGPYVKVRLRDGQWGDYVFKVEDFAENPEERGAIKKKYAEAKKKQVEANQAAQSSLSTTDVLLKELIREQKQTNEWLKKVRWSLLMIHIIMVLWYVFGWVIFPI